MKLGERVGRVLESLDGLDRRWSASLYLKNLPASPQDALPWQWPVVLCARLADGPLWIITGAVAMMLGGSGLRGATTRTVRQRWVSQLLSLGRSSLVCSGNAPGALKALSGAPCLAMIATSFHPVIQLEQLESPLLSPRWMPGRLYPVRS